MLAVVGPISAQASSEPILAGPAADQISKADVERIRTLCTKESGTAPWRIAIHRSPLGEKEKESDPPYFPLLAFAYLPANQTSPRSQSGITLEFSQGRKAWFLEARKRRWISVKSPADTANNSTVWYDTPFEVGATVTYEDAVEVLDLLFRIVSRQEQFETVAKDPNSGLDVPVQGSAPDVSRLKEPILRMGIGSTGDGPGELRVDIGVWGEATWAFAVFKKDGKKWKLKDVGYGISLHSPRVHSRPS